MIKEIRKRLADSGYHMIAVKPEEAVVYYRYDSSNIYAVIVIDYHKEFNMSPAQASQMQEKMKTILREPSRYIPDFPQNNVVSSTEVLLLLIAKNMECAREICAQNISVWAVDVKEKRLCIYENQPGNFYGLKEMIEKEIQSKITNEVSQALHKPYKQKQQGSIFYRPDGDMRAVMTVLIVAVNVIVWLLLELMGDTNSSMFMLNHGAMEPESILIYGEWWRVFTCMFLHFGPEHLVNNMLMLFLIGIRLESLGKLRFLLLYFLAGITGNLLSLWGMVKTGDMAVSAGASGCIFGIMGALAAAVILNKGRFKGLTTRGLIFITLLSLYFGFTTSGVDNWAHVGGLIGGIILGVIFYWGKRRKY